MDDKITRNDVVDYLVKTRLIETCCECQIAKRPSEKPLLNDLIQDMWVWAMTYDEKKLVNAYSHHHLNALITRTIVNNIWSTQSPFFKNYHRQESRQTEITERELNLPEDYGE